MAGAEHTWEVFAEERLEGGYAATDYGHVELDYAPHERGRCVVWFEGQLHDSEGSVEDL